MFSKFLNNLKGGILILIKPSYLKERVDSINSSIDLHTGFSIVAKSVFNELEKLMEKYPADKDLHLKIAELSLYGVEDKEDLKTLILEKKALTELPEVFCASCHRPYLISCPHEDTKKPD